MGRRKVFLVCLVCVLLAGCASGTLGNRTSASYEEAGGKLQTTIETYQKIEPRLTAAQREQFKEAYGGISKAYQTAGILLASVMDAADEASAHTAVVSYRRITSELPAMIDKLDRLVRGFR